jgi:hypothetical protein
MQCFYWAQDFGSDLLTNQQILFLITYVLLEVTLFEYDFHISYSVYTGRVGKEKHTQSFMILWRISYGYNLPFVLLVVT